LLGIAQPITRQQKWRIPGLLSELSSANLPNTGDGFEKETAQKLVVVVS